MSSRIVDLNPSFQEKPMNRWIAPLVAATLLLLGGQVSHAQEKEDDGPSVKEQLAKIAALGESISV